MLVVVALVLAAAVLVRQLAAVAQVGRARRALLELLTQAAVAAVEAVGEHHGRALTAAQA